MTQINIQTLATLFSPLDVSDIPEQWERLHAGDREPLPNSETARHGWWLFHTGRFLEAADEALSDEALLSLRLKSLSTYAHYMESDESQRLAMFQSVISEAKEGLKTQPDALNLHYQLAYSLGRYSQCVSITRALSEGLAGQIAASLERCLELDPQHADAHTAFATYQAELIGKLGKMAARLTYGASVDDAVKHYQLAIELAPYSVSAKTEYADGLLSMAGKKQRQQAISLYQEAVSVTPADALEALDFRLAKAELDGL
ncbi:hypothetical protein [Reinekea blandensis]|uniref:Uncharacterized protein n=1 Tax=Reinekea blandensis MED297 TaxID=314283 RepID=A4BH61_9GAMM|nr:hypothetical protein [Reinekea blandensis]EAR08560.1 hypothetical protein MED297_15100 [Reinekea sp. MED297] [Reinekea blandensis MED297]